jgi:hypothetical protein
VSVDDQRGGRIVEDRIDTQDSHGGPDTPSIIDLFD